MEDDYDEEYDDDEDIQHFGLEDDIDEDVHDIARMKKII